jgi:hypothetical protein
LETPSVLVAVLEPPPVPETFSSDFDLLEEQGDSSPVNSTIESQHLIDFDSHQAHLSLDDQAPTLPPPREKESEPVMIETALRRFPPPREERVEAMSAEVDFLREEVQKNATKFTSWLGSSSSVLDQQDDFDRGYFLSSPSNFNSEEAFFDPIALGEEEISRPQMLALTDDQSNFNEPSEEKPSLSSKNLFCTKFINTGGEGLSNLIVEIPGTDLQSRTDQSGHVCFKLPLNSSFFLVVRDDESRIQTTFVEDYFGSESEVHEHLIEETAFPQEIAKMFQIEQSLRSGGFCAWIKDVDLSGFQIWPEQVENQNLQIGYFDDQGWPDPTLTALSQSGGFCLFNLQQSFLRFQISDVDGSQISPILNVFLYPGVFRLFDLYPQVTLRKAESFKSFKHVSEITGFQSARGDKKWLPHDSGWEWNLEHDDFQGRQFSLAQPLLEVSSGNSQSFQLLNRHELLMDSVEREPGVWESTKLLTHYEIDDKRLGQMEKELSQNDRYDVDEVLGKVLLSLSSQSLQDADLSNLKIDLVNLTGDQTMLFKEAEADLTRFSNKRKAKVVLRSFPGQHVLVIRDSLKQVLALRLVRVYPNRIQMIHLD